METPEQEEETIINQENDQECKSSDPADSHYTIQFREKEPVFFACSRIDNLTRNEIVMVQTDHGLEPARTTSASPGLLTEDFARRSPAITTIIRRANRDEESKFSRLKDRELEAFDICRKLIAHHKLSMKLIKVERFFNGSKIIFYFTSENRVDFRELVKSLVQEFRTRVEMRQVGVRHETKMIGGLGCCGRELCCSSFITNFAPVSIKMAKEQSLPLNPAKISGICNRLLCCLTYEFSTYKALRKDMPKPGKNITIDGTIYKVLQANILQETITAVDPESQDKPVTFTKKQWQEQARPLKPVKKESKKPTRESNE